MRSEFAGVIFSVLVATTAVTAPRSAHSLTLTADGVSKGFTLSLFLDQAPSMGYCCGPLGIATNSSGQVVMHDYQTKTNSVYKNVDGQHFSDALSAKPFGASTYGSALAFSGGSLYGTQNDLGGVIVKLNADGSTNGNLTGPGAGGHGLWTNPVTGHLVASTGVAINDINPTTGAVLKLVNGVDVDGLSVATDGSVVYGASSGHVFGWSYSTGTLVYDSGNLGSPDGTGVIQGNNPYAGDIVANANDGRVWLLDPVAKTATVIANGGTRGDYVGVDNTNGSLFLTQTSEVYRLNCGPQCGFTAPVPEPQTLALMLAGLVGIGSAAARVRRTL